MLTKILNKLNLLDAQNNLSITNIAVIVVLVKLVLTPQWTLNEAGMLLLTIANYSHKRYVINQAQGNINEPSNN